MSMKKDFEKKLSLNHNFVSKNISKVDSIKTTNVNILLNRVRLDQKKTLKKKIIFSIILISIISSLAVYFTV